MFVNSAAVACVSRFCYRNNNNDDIGKYSIEFVCEQGCDLFCFAGCFPDNSSDRGRVVCSAEAVVSRDIDRRSTKVHRSQVY